MSALPALQASHKAQPVEQLTIEDMSLQYLGDNGHLELNDGLYCVRGGAVRTAIVKRTDNAWLLLLPGTSQQFGSVIGWAMAAGVPLEGITCSGELERSCQIVRAGGGKEALSSLQERALAAARAAATAPLSDLQDDMHAPIWG